MLKTRFLLFASAIVIGAATACNDRSAEGRTTEVTYLLDKNEPSPMFWDYAASTNLLQTELSQLVQQKTSDSQLLNLTDSVYYTHSRALSRLRVISEKYKNVQLPDSLTGADKSLINDFSALEEEELKLHYLEYLQQSNASQLSRYQEALAETEDPALRLWLNTIRTRLRHHAELYNTIDTVKEVE